ncbi:hypothetical protein ZEAMMB73_Zm00001d045752 [Zea mays]|uniref:DUF4283 domain-containing protein n=1 Tax=Zea mays TaxID=4577 RepID=A0A1D6NYQ6_MAIZE|nr:hypothetical protein ZEAMMB73_Zm00001d045752 [Zea mays]
MLDELTNFTELKMKISGVKIVVTAWTSQAMAKSRLHSVWIKAKNVPEELLNYQAICEMGSVLGAVEEVDLASLKSNDTVEKVETEGWNEEEASMRKRSSVDLQPNEFGLGDKGGKNPKVISKKVGSDEDLLSSQELNNFVKGMGVEIADDKELEMDEGELLKFQVEQQTVKDNKGKAKLVDQVEGTRKSSRLEGNEDIRITDKAINRAEAKDAFLNKGNNSGGIDWLEDKSGGDISKNKSDCTEGGGSGSRGDTLGASASAPAKAAPSLPQSTHIRPRSTRKRKPTHKSVYDL